MTPIRLVPLAALLCLMAACSKAAPDSAPQGKDGAKPAAPAVVVEVQPIGTASLTRRLQAVGSLVSDESVTVAAEVAGRVRAVGFKEGQPVTRGSLLFALDDSLERAALAQAQATLQLSERNDRRATEIAARGLIAASERDEVAAKLAVDRAALQLAQARVAKMRIVAPFDGVTGLRKVGLGDYVSPGEELVNLEVLDPMKLDFRLPEAALPVLNPGQKLEAEVDAWPGEKFAGEVYAVDPRIAGESRSIAVRARLANDAGKLRPGLFARVALQTAVQQEALVVPEQAIFPQGDQLFVYVVEDGKAMLRQVKVGQREPGRAEITEGLKAGETLIVTGAQKLSPGGAVRVAQPSSPPAAPAAPATGAQ